MTEDIQKATETLSQESNCQDQGKEMDERLIAFHKSYPPRWLTPTIQLSPWLHSDQPVLVKYLNMPEVYSFICGPPFPYLPSDGDTWIRGTLASVNKDGIPENHCIRDMTMGGVAIGNVYVSLGSDDDLTGSDIGYWLAPEYHGQGLMAKALKLILQEVAIKEGKRNFNAYVFEGNWASRRTLEKAGFVYLPELDSKGPSSSGCKVNMWTLRLLLTAEEDIARREVVYEVAPEGKSTMQ
ncbi:hypothetical protein BG004_006932 [Podila humilis]|nr:hypothetical protein BG004_006932 [Podila humilis]